MGNCQKEWSKSGQQLVLDPEMFVIEHLIPSPKYLSVAKLSQLLLGQLKPEFIHLDVTLSPPVTEELVLTVSKGHKVEFKGLVKNKLKVRLKVILRKGDFAILHFTELTCTTGELVLQLAKRLKVQAADLNAIYQRVRLEPTDRLDSCTNSHSLKLTIVEAGLEVSLAKTTSLQAWKLTAAGLNYEATCSNPYCFAYEQMVMVPKGFGSFQLKEDELIGDNCPCCKGTVKLVAYGVLNCNYTFSRNQPEDNTNKGMLYERLQAFHQMIGSPSISVSKLGAPSV